MELELCQHHQKAKNVVDLDLLETICERCALFDPLHQRHNFIESEHLQEHSMSQVNDFQKAIRGLNIVTVSGQLQQWTQLKDLSSECLQSKVSEINSMYDQMIVELQKERAQKISEITSSIKTVEEECQSTANAIAKDSIEKLCCINFRVQELAKTQNYLEIERVIAENGVMESIKLVEKEMEVIKIDLKQKLAGVCSNPFEGAPLTKKKVSIMEELLLNDEEENQFLSMKLSSSSKLDYLTCSSNCKTELSFCEYSCGLPCFASQSTLNQSHFSLEQPKKRAKTILNKAQIKTLHIRNDIRTVVFSSLSLNNRQALQAIKMSSNSTFVSKIQLNNNNLTSQLILMLKRQRNQSKYLKTITMKGIKIDQKALAKEGIRVESVSSGRIQLGDITIEF